MPPTDGARDQVREPAFRVITRFAECNLKAITCRQKEGRLKLPTVCDESWWFLHQMPRCSTVLLHD